MGFGPGGPEMVLMSELWFAVVPPPSAPTSFFMFLPKASTNLSGAEAFDLSGRLVEDLRQVSRTPKRFNASTLQARQPFR